MKETRVIADRFRDGTEKSNDLMLHFALNFANALHIEARLSPDPGNRSLRNFAEPCQTLSRKDFHVKPLLEAVFFMSA